MHNTSNNIESKQRPTLNFVKIIMWGAMMKKRPVIVKVKRSDKVDFYVRYYDNHKSLKPYWLCGNILKQKQIDKLHKYFGNLGKEPVLKSVDRECCLIMYCQW